MSGAPRPGPEPASEEDTGRVQLPYGLVAIYVLRRKPAPPPPPSDVPPWEAVPPW
jgi:hypothetical protein